MFCFANEGYADMHFEYGFCDNNSRGTEAEYYVRYPHPPAPNSDIPFALLKRLRDTSSFHKMGERVHYCLSATVEMHVLDLVVEYHVWVHGRLREKVEFQKVKR